MRESEHLSCSEAGLSVSLCEKVTTVMECFQSVGDQARLRIFFFFFGGGRSGWYFDLETSLYRLSPSVDLCVSQVSHSIPLRRE